MLGAAIALSIPCCLYFADASHARCGDYVSYYQTADGVCIDLTYMSEMSSQSRSDANPIFSDDFGEIAVTNLRLDPNSIGADVRGTIQNTASYDIEVFNVRYQLLSGGTPIYSGSFFVDAVLSPGQTLAIEDFVLEDDLQGRSPRSLEVEALSVM